MHYTSKIMRFAWTECRDMDTKTKSKFLSTSGGQCEQNRYLRYEKQPHFLVAKSPVVTKGHEQRVHAPNSRKDFHLQHACNQILIAESNIILNGTFLCNTHSRGSTPTHTKHILSTKRQVLQHSTNSPSLPTKRDDPRKRWYAVLPGK